jgi:hypothetical protein
VSFSLSVYDNVMGPDTPRRAKASPMSRRGWIVLGFGFLVSLAPLVREPLVAEYPADTGIGLALFYLWSPIPFLALATTTTVWLAGPA